MPQHVTLNLQDLQQKLVPVLEAHGVRKAVLFGSYAKGTATEKSDVDLLVDSGLHGLRFVGLLEEIREALDREIGLFDVAHIEPGSRIDLEIRRTGKVIYERAGENGSVWRLENTVVIFDKFVDWNRH